MGWENVRDSRLVSLVGTDVAGRGQDGNRRMAELGMWRLSTRGGR